MEPPSLRIPQHTRIVRPYNVGETEVSVDIVFNSEFDSGNCEKVEFKQPNEVYIIA